MGMVAAGDIWEGHEILSELERGMVHTFLARQLGDTTALVWLHIRSGARFEREVFAAEIDRLQRLSDEVPQIARVLYGGISDTAAWVASPVYKDAIRLKDATRGAALGLTALKMVIELGRVLTRAHEAGASHGALSPERVLITADQGYAFTHFGFARLFRIEGEQAIHEPQYAAPELVFGGRLGQRTDVYGLGTLLYELVCKRELYSSSDHDPRTDVGKIWEPSFPPFVPLILQFVMKMALAKEPRHRYASIEKMLDVVATLADKGEDLFRQPERPDDPTATSPLIADRERQEPTTLVVDDNWEPFASVHRAAHRAAEPSGPLRPGLPARTKRHEHRGCRGRLATSGASSPPSDLNPLPPGGVDGVVEPESISLFSPLLPALPIRARSRRSTGILHAARTLAHALALVSILGVASAPLWWPRPLEHAAHLPKFIRFAAAPSAAPPHHEPSERLDGSSKVAPPPTPEPLLPIQHPSFTRRTAETSTATGLKGRYAGPYLPNGDTSY